MLKSQTRIILLLATIGLFQGCGDNFRADKYPHTGNDEQEVLLSAAIQSQDDIEVGQKYYIAVNSLRFRSEPNLSNDSRLGILSLNDEVRVINTDVPEPFVEIEILATNSRIPRSERYFTSLRYLRDTKANLMSFDGDYFMIQNIATEKLRVYERICEDNSCAHQMILESDMAVGEDKEGVRTALGSYRITSWSKFYQDYSANYPSWYHPSYPDPPSDRKGIRSWTRSRYMPNGNGSMRGAFGWYTAKVGPNHHAHWTHGTIGWGEKSHEFIEQTRGFFANLFFSPRSSGCSRVDNQTISYLREILPTGTPLIKIYAKEAYLDSELKNYTQESDTWDYILTTREARTYGGETADREKILAKGITDEEILEEGTYTIDMIPKLVQFNEPDNLTSRFRIRSDRVRQANGSGNIYAIPEDRMQGTFYIDAGLIKDYDHPSHEKIVLGGFRNLTVPEFIDYDAFDL